MTGNIRVKQEVWRVMQLAQIMAAARERRIAAMTDAPITRVIAGEGSSPTHIVGGAEEPVEDALRDEASADRASVASPAR